MSDSTGTHDCVYATSAWQDADERAIGVLLDLGWTPLIVSLGRDVSDEESLATAVAAASTGGRHVVAAPAVGAALEAAGIEAFRLAPSVDLDAFPFHAPWIDAFLLGVPPHAHLVLSLRGHRPANRVGDVVDAFARIPRRVDVHEDFPDPHLLIGNAGPDTLVLKDQVRSARVADRTRFLGWVPQGDLVPLLGRGSCVVNASEEPTCPASILQAMACGTPVIAADTSATAGWIEDGVTGFTYPLGDVEALAQLIDRVVVRYPTDVVQRARAHVEAQGDWTREAGRLAAAFERA